MPTLTAVIDIGSHLENVLIYALLVVLLTGAIRCRRR
jgi:hypothetical protein